jgi:DNA replication and repair protein RecF
MSILRFDVRCARNILECQLDLHPQFNCITGQNGSGKTSFIEAVHLLATGRSFRTQNLRNLININKKEMFLYAELQADHSDSPPISAGYWRNTAGKRTVKLNHAVIETLAPIAYALPVCVMEGNFFRGLLLPAECRRRLLDWGVFHVEHSFFNIWREYQAILAQRNALLRSGEKKASFLKTLEAWDALLLSSGLQVTHLREKYFQILQGYFEKNLNLLWEEQGGLNIQMIFNQGWSSGKHLGALLEASRGLDIDHGYTRFGPHRADISFLSDRLPAKEILSRGQQKRVMIAFLLASIEVYRLSTQKCCTVLVDDLAAELDECAREKVYALFSRLHVQWIVTAIEPNFYKGLSWVSDGKMFHVEQGAFRSGLKTML